ncbi:C39 family peptidase [Mesorhizobium sp. B2-1-8]|uniref:C39 family peptidase n=1 Tax=Mesorhizobium sp. B2-1-8 TaxID=2589967 RepID=UPI00112B422A|nr:C39 family peptidase [Mesorhizobium sp. B2-1-8]UCI22056.1 C39 family peptidase [Mesorhizobium sp. B2-1-8]
MSSPPEVVPFFSQWETPDMTLAVLADGADAALRRDPLWQGSGAGTLDEYAVWAANVCGMACLKMILATRGQVVPTIELARRCTGYGGYVVNEGSIKGLIYAPFVTFVKQEFGIEAEVMTNVAATDIPAILAGSRFFIASVSSSIRWPEREPPSKGGHLVLVTAASHDGFRFHNPSGHTSATQANAVLAPADFDRFFANRGIAVSI